MMQIKKTPEEDLKHSSRRTIYYKEIRLSGDLLLIQVVLASAAPTESTSNTDATAIEVDDMHAGEEEGAGGEGGPERSQGRGY